MICMLTTAGIASGMCCSLTLCRPPHVAAVFSTTNAFGFCCRTVQVSGAKWVNHAAGGV